MSDRIIRRERAIEDLASLAAHIAADSPMSAERFLEAAEKAFDLLARMPGLGSACEFRAARAEGLRIWAIRGFEKHIIFYQIIDDGIEVVRVLHGRDTWSRCSNEPPQELRAETFWANQCLIVWRHSPQNRLVPHNPFGGHFCSSRNCRCAPLALGRG